ncbi:hypothetical protein ILUMI_27550 [Ignelater luminosus]|uniref:Uncharacterized protein n=1 Tax=Ignelater luminosus TaxID=2038154 RepID=A0A8K0C6B5_IGNLU|nr:hypothetical protein ILUMI_27550 [Ignelater luminosus]
MALKAFRCVYTAIKLKLKSKNVKKDHWLDFAVEKHGKELVNELKIVSSILFLYIPIPLFWGLFEQIATTWTYQARQMNGEIGDTFTIPPGQIQLSNPIFVMILIPLFVYVIYPNFANICVFRTALRRITLGGFLVWVSFVITAFNAMRLEENYPALPLESEAQIRIFNVLPCDITIFSRALNSGRLLNMTKLSLYTQTLYSVIGTPELNFDMTSSCSSIKGKFTLTEAEAATYYFKDSNKEPIYIKESVRESIGGFINVRIVINLNGKYDEPINITFGDDKNGMTKTNSSSLNFIRFSNPGIYTIELGNLFKIKQKFSLGGVYSLNAIAVSANQFDVKNLVIAKPNNIHVLWIIPPYIVISVGEILFSITGSAFSYCQTPKNMKTLVLGVWFLTFCIGQLIVVAVEYIRIFEKASARFFLYAAFMVIDMILFIAMTMGYKYAEYK